MNFQKVKSGQKINIKADEWNAVRQNALGDDRPFVPNRYGTGNSVNVKNDQLEVVPAYGVLSVTGPIHINGSLFGQQSQAAENRIEIKAGPPTGEADEILCIIQRLTYPTRFSPCVVVGPTHAWVYVNDTGHLYAQAIPENVQMLETADAGPVRLMHKAHEPGLQLLPVILGLPAGETSVAAKELFPAVVYRRNVETTLQDGTVEETPETYIICPGGRGTDKSIKTVHVLHVEKKTVSTKLFGSLTMAMSNFGAVLADNGYGEPMLVCAPGEVDEGSRYPVQRYEFSQELWSKSDTAQSLAGCPAYVVDGKMIVAGGQSAYYVSNPIKTAGSGTTQFYGHVATPFWAVDPIAGTLENRVPRRIIVSGTSEQPESHTVNQQKRFLKQNFSGVFLGKERSEPVEFLAVGGTELLGYQSKAVVSYAMNSTGPLLDCEHADIRIGGDCDIFPDTPIPLGECAAVRIRKRKSGNMTVDCDWLVCVGGRYRDENGKFVLHKTPWSLDLENKAEGWRNDLFPELKTPRYNAALSDVVSTVEEVPVMQTVTHPDGTTTEEPVTDPETGKPVTETKSFDRVFLLGGRTEKGLTASVEAFNLTTWEWETDWPGLDGRITKQ